MAQARKMLNIMGKMKKPYILRFTQKNPLDLDQ